MIKDLLIKISEVISIEPEIKISFGNLLTINKEDDGWIVEYESYFNPHANPKSLFDKKRFTDPLAAVIFFFEKVHEMKV
jgi:hypothetical protein